MSSVNRQTPRPSGARPPSGARKEQNLFRRPYPTPPFSPASPTGNKRSYNVASGEESGSDRDSDTNMSAGSVAKKPKPAFNPIVFETFTTILLSETPSQNLRLRGLQERLKKCIEKFPHDAENIMVLLGDNQTKRFCIDFANALNGILERNKTLNGVPLSEETRRERVDFNNEYSAAKLLQVKSTWDEMVQIIKEIQALPSGRPPSKTQ